MQIRKIETSDAQNFINLVQQVEKESKYMLYEPGEREITAEQQRKRIETIKQEAHSAIFLAESGSSLAGYLMAIGGSACRTKHTVYLVIGILKEYRGQGIGKRLFDQLEHWAGACGIHRLELTVVTQNQAALALYKKCGFEIEGTKRDSMLINGGYMDEYHMAKLLQAP